MSEALTITSPRLSWVQAEILGYFKIGDVVETYSHYESGWYKLGLVLSVPLLRTSPTSTCLECSLLYFEEGKKLPLLVNIEHRSYGKVRKPYQAEHAVLSQLTNNYRVIPND